MSVVAVKKYKDKIVMAADSIAVSYGYLKTGESLNRDKIFKTKEMIIGGSGSAFETAILQEFVKSHKPINATDTDVLSFMIEFSDYLKSKIDVKSKNSYLMIYKGKIFEIHGVYVFEIKDFAAIGAGVESALTALHLGCSPKEAVKVTCEINCYTSEPIIEYEELLADEER